MPAGYFQPLPRSNNQPTSDYLRRWLNSQTFSFEKIISGSLQSGQTLGSANFVTGTSGWEIDGDGNAEFNDAVFRGTITGSVFQTAASGERLVIDGADGDAFITIYNSSGNIVGYIGWNATGYGASDLAITTERDTNDIVLTAHGGIELYAGGSAGYGVTITNPDVAGGIPGKVFRIVADDGAGMLIYDSDAVATPTWAFDSDPDTGINHVASNQIGMVVSATQKLVIKSGGGSAMELDRRLTDVGNHETLRLNRDTTAGLENVGYYSSWLNDPEDGHARKHRVVKLHDKSQWWNRKWFMDLEPIKYERVKGQKAEVAFQNRPIEMGFYIENLIEHTNLLTTKGNQIGGSPDEYALLAVTVDYVQHLERRVAALEGNI